jgi:hypothetical protein
MGIHFVCHNGYVLEWKKFELYRPIWDSRIAVAVNVSNHNRSTFSENLVNFELRKILVGHQLNILPSQRWHFEKKLPKLNQKNQRKMINLRTSRVTSLRVDLPRMDSNISNCTILCCPSIWQKFEQNVNKIQLHLPSLSGFLPTFCSHISLGVESEHLHQKFPKRFIDFLFSNILLLSSLLSLLGYCPS